MRTLRREGWTIYVLLILECYAAYVVGARVQQKAESAVPIPTLSPPEGNTTFISGTTWCVAIAGVTQSDLQTALDWVCGEGAADCSAVQQGNPCFEPDSILSHASFAFNSYYQQNGNSDIACNFGGAATIITRNPSYGSCKYLSSEQPSAATWIGQRDLTATMLLCVYNLLLLLLLMNLSPLINAEIC